MIQRSPGIDRRRLLQLAAAAMASLGGSGIARAAVSGPPLKVKLVNSSGTLNHTFQQVLIDQGFFREFGIEPTTVNVSDGSKIISALVSGDEDICMFSGFNQVFPAIERGATLKILAASTTLGQQAIMTRRPDIQGIKDLAGKTIGVGALGALLHATVVAVLIKNDIDLNSVKFVNVGSTADVFRAIVAGTVDAGPCASDVFGLAPKYNIRIIQDGGFWDSLPEFVFQGSYASDRAIAGKREALVRTLAAYCKLYRFMCGPNSLDGFNKARIEALGKGENGSAETEWQFIQQHQSLAVNLTVAEDRLDFMQNLNVRLGVQKKVLPYSQVADMSLAEEAVKLVGQG